MRRVARRAAQALEVAEVTAPAVAVMSTSGACIDCAHRAEDRRVLEQGIAGLVIFGSGFGASVAASRLCRVHDRLVSPGDSCTQFLPRD